MIFFKNKSLFIGSCLIACILLFASASLWVAPQSYLSTQIQEKYTPPSSKHWFGQDELGSDILAQAVYGAKVSLSIALWVTLICFLIGLLIGTLCGVKGGWWDRILSGWIDAQYAFPGFLLALAFVAFLPPSMMNLIVALSITGWCSFARLVRGEVLSLKQRTFVEGAVSIGVPYWKIIFFHIWPNLIPLILIQSTFHMSGVILAESGLSFLGLGMPSSVPTWGSLLQRGAQHLIGAPHILFFPCVLIVILLLGLQLMSRGLQEVLNPYKTFSK